MENYARTTSPQGRRILKSYKYLIIMLFQIIECHPEMSTEINSA